MHSTFFFFLEEALFIYSCIHYLLYPAGTVCEEEAIRLVNGASNNQGRLEICFNNLWGSVCDDQFDNNEAKVACRQLGYSNYELSVAVGFGYFGRGQSAIHLDELRCVGTETRIADCVHGGVGNHNCGHNEDAGVICVGKIDLDHYCVVVLDYVSYSCTFSGWRIVYVR